MITLLMIYITAVIIFTCSFGLIIGQDNGIRTTIIFLLAWPLWFFPLLFIFLAALLRGIITNESYDTAFDAILVKVDLAISKSELLQKVLRWIK